ncbi:MAG: 2OG-Fe(II) oxygenase [Candidatus Thioglobus sp.]|nr:2OG-Fe(II) oxygenase [Candidatus Thioglobus sp.]
MITVIDNFMDEEYHTALKELFLSVNDRITWVYVPSNTSDHMPPPIEGYEGNVGIPQFVSQFLNNAVWANQDIVAPLLNKIEPDGLFRIMANMKSKQESNVAGGWHYDPCPEMKEVGKNMVALYYVNDNNGGTVFDDGTKVDCKENRMVLFPCSMAHAPIHQTDIQTRVIININYYKKDNND